MMKQIFLLPALAAILATGAQAVELNTDALKTMQQEGHRIVEESEGGRADGLGLLDVRTTLAVGKTLTRTAATHLPSGHEVFGYEIHHGQSMPGEFSPIFTREDGTASGVGREDHRIWGTSIHGVFDADEFRRWFIDRLRSRQGLASDERAMCPTESLELHVIEGLDTNRESVDSRRAKTRKTRLLDCARIEFERRLDLSRGLGRRKRRVDRVQQFANRFGPKQRRSSAAEIDAGQRPALEILSPCSEFQAKRLDVASLSLGLERRRQGNREIAVGTDPLAEGQMQVDADTAIVEGGGDLGLGCVADLNHC